MGLPASAYEFKPCEAFAGVRLALARGIIFIVPAVFTRCYASSPSISTPLRLFPRNLVRIDKDLALIAVVSLDSLLQTHIQMGWNSRIERKQNPGGNRMRARLCVRYDRVSEIISLGQQC